MIDLKDLKLLWMFTLRTGMYTGVENQYTISSFLHGYEAGREGECDFTGRLSISILEDYKIEGKATGWPGQIHLVAEQLNTEWTVVFKQQSLKIISSELPNLNLQEFQESLRKRIHGMASGLNYQFGKGWVIEWFGIVNLSTEWFKKIWTGIEFEIIEEIESELKTSGNYKNLNGKIPLSDELRRLCDKLNDEMNLKDKS